jgi:hypothetical protein
MSNNSVAFTKKVTLTSKKPITKENFVKKIKVFSKNILDYLKDNGCSKLGHIKFISTTNGEDYLQISLLDMKEKPKVEGFLRKTFGKIKLTLNIIVFGVKRKDIDKKIDEEINNLEDYFNSS